MLLWLLLLPFLILTVAVIALSQLNNVAKNAISQLLLLLYYVSHFPVSLCRTAFLLLIHSLSI